MDYVKAINGTVIEYPYTIRRLREDYPSVSFPVTPDAALLSEYNVFPVLPSDPPNFNRFTHDCKLANPVLVDGNWVRGWNVTELDAAKIEFNRSEESMNVRNVRDYKLSLTDWTQLKDIKLSESRLAQWAEYRQNLRDVPAQEGFPFVIIWPNQPV